MFNFGTIGAYKQARNNPRCKATTDLKNGQVVVLDEIKKEASLPSADDVVGKDLWVVFNIIDKPEVLSTNDFKVEEGEFVRAFLLADLVGLPVQLGHQVVKDYDSLVAGDTLVVTTDGKWEKSSDASGNAISLEVIAKTGFAEKGLDAIVHVSTTATGTP